MATVAALLVDLGANVARLRSDMNQANRVISGWEKSTKKAVSNVTGLFAGLGVAIGAGAFVHSIKQMIDQADEFGKLSQKVGIATEALSEFSYAADLSGVTREGLTKGLKSLSTNMFEAARGTKDYVEIFKGLNLSFEESPGKLRNVDAVLLDVADKFSKMKDGTDKSAIAVKLFGKAGLDMIPMLNQGRDGIEKLREEARRLGIVMSAETAAAAERFNDNMRAVSASADGLKLQIANAMLPALNNIAIAMKEAAKEGGVFKAILVGIGGAMHEIFAQSDQQKLAELDKRLAGLRQRWTDLRNVRQGYRGNMNNRLGGVESEIAEVMREKEAIEQQIAQRQREAAARALNKPDPKGGLDTRKFGDGEKKDDSANLFIKQWVEDAEEWDKIMSEASQLTDDFYRKQREGEAELDATRMKAWLEFIDREREQEDAMTRLANGFDENGNKIEETSNEMKKTAEEVGLIFQSAASDAIRDWKGVGNLVKSIGRDIAQLIFKKMISDPIAGFVSKSAGSFIDGLFKAEGGPVMGGHPYIVGERGPELFVPGMSGGIVPNSAMAGMGGGVTIVQNNHFALGLDAVVRDGINRELPRIAQAAVSAVRADRNRTGDAR